MAVGNAIVNITANTQPVIDSMATIGAAWLEFGEYMTAAADAMLRAVQALREQQAEETGDMWGEEPFVCATHDDCQFSESA